ncbi:RidA family protein [Halanaerobium kushneri]|uniref:Enamine deaminase RidA, house cleaning of reactive enamine intermediates, YjgF/YER057c/UK114 family n=1 Tax=Halanaerobium kushneri TaxID=56779 RepID=A0A1N6S2Y4_9FIRM|nr:RidA family protein [Halanaerobium kushneri]SIQ35503.1 Enamine deaminase RidA, house cleaning of reactive enamine intermediates, YjgF/YER057c/UK114 family [Halanaerobium kushneri]
MGVEAKIKELGLELPETPAPIAEYIPAKRVNDLVYVSGQGPISKGKFIHIGKVGESVSLDEGYQSAQQCCLNALAAVKSVVGSLDEIEEIVKLRGFVNSTDDFLEQPKVINGASELLVKIFGEKGRHARAALGTSVLPDDIPVELEMIVKVKSD